MIQNKIIGLTGCSGSGKTSVSNICKKLGAYIVDADALNHANMLPGGAAYSDILQEFGSSILDCSGLINRRALGEIVFSDKEKMKRLEAITHSHVVRQTHALVDAVQNEGSHAFIVIDAPLLIEAGLHKLADEVWVVVADYEKRLARVCSRDELSRTQAEKRFSAGTSSCILEEHANFIIENNNDISILENTILRILT